MDKRFRLLYWLVVNLLLLAGSVIMPWFRVGFEPHPAGVETISGWKFIWESGNQTFQFFLKYGFDWFLIFSILVDIGALLIIAYMAISIMRAANIRTTKGNKPFSLAMIIVALIFLYDGVIQGPPVLFPLLGFWLFILGLISSIVFEWLSPGFAS